MKEKFLNCIEPFLSYIDNGKLFRKPFSWLYMAFAVGCGIFPFYLLYAAIDGGIFDLGAKYIFAFLILWVFILAAAWVGVQIWWNRKDKVLETSQEGSDFPATPVIAHLIQTSGECLGAFIAIIGVGFSLVVPIFDAGMLKEILPLGGGLEGVILFPIFGFLAIISARFTAEMCRVLVSIANNTKK